MKKIFSISFLFISLLSLGHSRIFNVKLFGAHPDGIYDTTISITTGTNDVTSANSIFASTDVGKIIVILGAGTSGRDFKGTITAFVSATAVTVSSNAATTVTNAPTIWGTDQTTYIQAAIIAANTAGGGRVFIPNGIYLLDGALQTSIGALNMNAQLYIPTPGTAFAHTKTHIVIEGETPPNFSQYIGITAPNYNTYNGTTLVSTITTGATGSAVIGTQGYAGTFGSFNYTYLTVKNLSIKVLDNPAGAGPVVGGISYKKGASLFTDQLMICNMGSSATSVLPTNNISGIETPDNGGEAMTNLQNTLCAGFKNGFIIGEHQSLNQVHAYVCYNGFNFKTSFHAGMGARICSQWCRTDIFFSGPNSVGYVFLDAEWTYPAHSGGKWFDNRYTVNDSLNRGSMLLIYNLVKAYVGIENSHFATQGARNISRFASTGTGDKYFELRTSINSTTAGYSMYSASNAVAQIFKASTTYAYKNIGPSDFGFLGTNNGNFSFLNDYASGNISFSAGGNSTNGFRINTNNSLGVPGTNTATGTTGAQTINKTSGKVNFAAGATVLVVTNSLATTTSSIHVQVYGTDATATSARVTLAAGSFTITLNQAATAETSVGFTLLNTF